MLPQKHSKNRQNVTPRIACEAGTGFIGGKEKSRGRDRERGRKKERGGGFKSEKSILDYEGLNGVVSFYGYRLKFWLFYGYRLIVSVTVTVRN